MIQVESQHQGAHTLQRVVPLVSRTSKQFSMHGKMGWCQTSLPSGFPPLETGYSRQHGMEMQGFSEATFTPEAATVKYEEEKQGKPKQNRHCRYLLVQVVQSEILESLWTRFSCVSFAFWACSLTQHIFLFCSKHPAAWQWKQKQHVPSFCSPQHTSQKPRGSKVYISPIIPDCPCILNKIIMISKSIYQQYYNPFFRFYQQLILDIKFILNHFQSCFSCLLKNDHFFLRRMICLLILSSILV